MSLGTEWIGKDKALARRILDDWQTATGYIAPVAGLLFIEPAVNENGPGAVWCAANLEYTQVGAGVANRSVHPDRSFMVHCFLYFQFGTPEPTNWEAPLISVVESLLNTLTTEGGWPNYSLSHPIPLPAVSQESRSTTWAISGLTLRFKS